MRFNTLFGLLALTGSSVAIGYGNPPTRELRQRTEQLRAKRAGVQLTKRDNIDPAELYPAHNISVPIDFFPKSPRYEPHCNGTFNLRYWFDASHYKPGGPVFVLLAGETDGEGRLPFLQKGIVAQVAEATNGIGVILEHRYYGTSFPVPDLSVENLRFLSTEQALAEVNYFAQNVKFEGVDEDMTAPHAPWIVYGGSYAGAQAAFLRVAYPETFWGAISSSGVTVAIYDYWKYFEPIRQFAPPDVVKDTQFLVDVIDRILLPSNNTETADVKKLKRTFGMSGITDNRDFANVIAYGIYGWQSTNWDPEINSPDFFYYQTNLTATELVNPTLESERANVREILTTAGYKSTPGGENIILNAINYFNVTYLTSWSESKETQNDYFTTLDVKTYQQDDIASSSWRSWSWQFCTEWGYLQTGNTPKNIMPLISRTIDLEYTSAVCRLAFNINTPPNTNEVNKYGAFDIAADRLAIIGGNADPWKPATPLADEATPRNSTTERPVLEIAHGVHHWEENGIFKNETTPILPPAQVVYAQQFLKNFVIDWLKEWKTKNSYQEL